MAKLRSVTMVNYRRFQMFAGGHEAPVKILDKNAQSGPRNDITENLIRFIDGARKEILIQNPYCTLTDRAMAALARASATLPSGEASVSSAPSNRHREHKPCATAAASGRSHREQRGMVLSGRGTKIGEF